MTHLDSNSNEVLELEHFANDLVNKSLTAGKKIERLWLIAKHYRWSQITARGIKTVFARLPPHQIVKIEPDSQLDLHSDSRFAPLAQIVVKHHADHASHIRNDIRNGKIVLLNREHQIGWPFSWNAEDASHLWRFQLHYHEYLLHLIADASPRSPQEQEWQIVWEVIRDWVHNHQPGKVDKRADAWHPYCISRRLAVWAWLLILGQPEPETSRLVLNSFFQQANYLQKNLETDLRGNHLLENLTALVVAGSVLDCQQASEWLQTAESMLAKELAAQVLSTGEHFELSPMYHCQVLGNLLRMAILVKNKSPSLEKLCIQYAQRMNGFLSQIVHPDGEIPLLSDSCFHESPSASQLRELARIANIATNETPKGNSVCGHYWIHRESKNPNADFMIFDHGAAAPDELPAHGHCDLLTIEASIGGKRWLIDSGNFDYEAGSMRQYCRSSLAHNVMTVGGTNQCDIYSKFRMGRRGRILDYNHGKLNEFDWCRASHNGYRHLGVKRMERLIAVDQAKTWICADSGPGNTTTELIGYLHLSPTVEIDTINDNGFSLSDQFSIRTIQFFGIQNVSIKKGWYCNAFGVRQENQVFVYRAESSQIPCGWVISLAENELEISLGVGQLSVSNSKSTTVTNWNFA